MAEENKRYKDSVFTDLFYSDRDAEKNLLELYNALYDTDFTDPDVVEKCRLEDVIFMNFKNDVAALMSQKRLFLSEQQSTVNENMPLRMLLYVAREYEKLTDKRVRYRKRMVQIPTPQFITFYNGTEPFPKEKIIKLSDAFIDKSISPELELIVKVININTDSGAEIVKKCRILQEYSIFVDTARRCLSNNRDTGLEEAVNECMKNGILKEYLSRKSVEVVNMLLAEYSYAEDIQEKSAEAKEEGRMEGILISKRVFQFLTKHPKADDKEVAKACQCTVADVRNLRY